jgi:hypothetical protein
MRIVKPQRLGLVKRALPWGGRMLMSFGLITAFPFANPRRLLQEGEMWEAITPILGDRALDTGEPKARGEAVVFGSYHAPGGTPVLQHGARIAVGPIDKSIRITGRREWRRTPDNEAFATPPEPFTTMPLDDWRLAFGGPQFPDNPTGIGHWREDIFTADGRYPLPCLEQLRATMTAPTDVLAPICFGPRDIMLPDRQRKPRAGPGSGRDAGPVSGRGIRPADRRLLCRHRARGGREHAPGPAVPGHAPAGRAAAAVHPPPPAARLGAGGTGAAGRYAGAVP